jgi:putative FmdB family regulatory protein
MPLYEYECDDCGHRFEVIQKFSDGPIEKCPRCGGPVRKLQSAPAFQFKGSGWYITDYARKEPAGKSEGDAQKANGGDTKDSVQGEKPADKSTGGEGSSSGPAAKDSKSPDGDSKSAAKDSTSSARDSKSSAKDSRTA